VTAPNRRNFTEKINTNHLHSPKKRKEGGSSDDDESSDDEKYSSKSPRMANSSKAKMLRAQKMKRVNANSLFLDNKRGPMSDESESDKGELSDDGDKINKD